MHSQRTMLICWRCTAPLENYGVCQECRASNAAPGMLTARKIDAERRCWRCNRLLCFLYEFRGRAVIQCGRCKAENVFVGASNDGAINRGIARLKQEAMQAKYLERPAPQERPGVEAIIEMMEERWKAVAAERARTRATIAVGLRFDVFMRDGFRCRYCGVSVDDGAILHADHVVPQSKGGPTTLENLVTACVDCNLGKCAKMLT